MTKQVLIDEWRAVIVPMLLVHVPSLNGGHEAAHCQSGHLNPRSLGPTLLGALTNVELVASLQVFAYSLLASNGHPRRAPVVGQSYHLL